MGQVVAMLRARERRIPTEAQARADSAAGLREAREMAGYSREDWASTLSTIVGRPISAALVEQWEDPTGPKPPVHWALLLFIAAGPAALDLVSSLFLP